MEVHNNKIIRICHKIFNSFVYCGIIEISANSLIPKEKGAYNSNATHVISSKIDTVFANFSICRLMRSCSQRNVLVNFLGQELVSYINNETHDIFFKKIRPIDFSIPDHLTGKTTAVVTRIIDGINRLSSEGRASVLIVDDSLYDRSCSKKAEFL